ncbi:Transcriptional repressor NrdR [Methylacidimicrobium cyclopophantes]|uniref:Transcriptional repressor NrdR n=1 Tax=Methylacidimicrobium cyclopophantes TaxID=1041766 RepID=A0A5E6M8G5_9BACT|nr:transcriptional regulator NrdR [Methylacidimicrobium cyclopophantes]VVM05456.1 Transcriptional repressor NrdR [Methylacidimicrobium cyclopophantes]
MKCPKCGKQKDRVVDSRPLRDGAVIRRRRKCLKCGARFTTYEEIEQLALRVQKRDGSFEIFDRQKILLGVEKACEKRPVSLQAIENLVDRVVADLVRRHGQEIPSSEIGEKIVEGLRMLDEVAYVRFASVYRKFRDASDFVHAVKKLNRSAPNSETLPLL